MHCSSFYQLPLRDMFVRRVLWNMPKIKPEAYRQDPPDQTLPESPQIPPLTPPILNVSTQHAESPIAHSKRRKRTRTESPKREIVPKMDIVREHDAVSLDEPSVPLDVLSPSVSVPSTKQLNAVESMQWVPVPASSSKEKLKELQEYLKQDPYACRFCGDTFCRDPTWGDPYLVSCAKCDAKYHSFCVENKPSKAPWRCYKCQHAPRPGLSSILDNNPSVLCQFCHTQSPGIAGRLVEYGGLGETASNHVHENCAFYSKGVIKKDDQWYGLHTAVRESHFTKCSFCHKKGASIPCDFPKCRKLVHYVCAKQNECYLVESNQQHLYCDQHMETVLKNPEILSPSSKIPSLQIPPSSPHPKSPEISTVPQSNKKKSTRKNSKRKLSSVPDDEDGSLSCQVL